MNRSGLGASLGTSVVWGSARNFSPNLSLGLGESVGGTRSSDDALALGPAEQEFVNQDLGPQLRKTAKDAHDCRHPGQEGGTTGFEVAVLGAFAGAGLRGGCVCALSAAWRADGARWPGPGSRSFCPPVPTRAGLK